MLRVNLVRTLLVIWTVELQICKKLPLFKCSFYEKHVGPMLSDHFKEMGHNGDDPKAYFYHNTKNVV